MYCKIYRPKTKLVVIRPIVLGYFISVLHIFFIKLKTNNSKKKTVFLGVSKEIFIAGRNYFIILIIPI